MIARRLYERRILVGIVILIIAVVVTAGLTLRAAPERDAVREASTDGDIRAALISQLSAPTEMPDEYRDPFASMSSITETVAGASTVEFRPKRHSQSSDVFMLVQVSCLSPAGTLAAVTINDARVGGAGCSEGDDPTAAAVVTLGYRQRVPIDRAISVSVSADSGDLIAARLTVYPAG